MPSAMPDDGALKNYRRARRTVNDRLAKAEKEGRLEAELRFIEREARAWWAGETGKNPRKVR